MQGRKMKNGDEIVLTCPPKYKAKRRQVVTAIDASPTSHKADVEFEYTPDGAQRMRIRKMNQDEKIKR